MLLTKWKVLCAFNIRGLGKGLGTGSTVAGVLVSTRKMVPRACHGCISTPGPAPTLPTMHTLRSSPCITPNTPVLQTSWPLPGGPCARNALLSTTRQAHLSEVFSASPPPPPPNQPPHTPGSLQGCLFQPWEHLVTAPDTLH